MNPIAFVTAAAMAMTLGSTAQAAEPAPAAERPAETATPRAPELLASASLPKPSPKPSEAAPPVKKPRAARVTTCRCGEASPR